MTETSHIRLGIDFGGTKTEIIALNGQNGKELFRKRIPTPRDNYDDTLNSFKGLINEAESALGATGTIGMGIPGSISDDNGLVKNSNAVWMNGQPLKVDLEKLMGREIRIENDANCLAVGTGFGGGFAINGQAQKGINGVAGEWGHNPLPLPRMYVPEGFEIEPFYEAVPEDPVYPYITHDKSWNEMPGPVCYCGRRNCQELWLSGTGFKRDYHHVTGTEISTHDIITNARNGEPQAVAAYDRYIDRLARALGVVINLIDPDVIVLGGGMSNVASIYKDTPKIWDKYITSDIVHTKLAKAIHGDSSGVRGAAWLWGLAE